MNFKHPLLLLGLLVPLLVSVGCTRYVSRGLTASGEVSDLIFPDEGAMVVKGGTTPEIEKLRPLAAGMTKDQLRGLIGSPHFREGYSAREWDYLFQLRDPAGNVARCRFKVVFDTQMIARNLYWAPAECLRLLEPAPSAAQAPAAPEMSSGPRAPAPRFALSADTLFGFGKWSRQDLSAAGLQRLGEIAAELRQYADGIQDVRVTGYADRIGDAAANQRLSQRRAETVRDVLVSAGLPAAGVIAQGLGERRSLTDCSPALPQAALIGCLAPDRRVEIEVRPAR